MASIGYPAVSKSPAYPVLPVIWIVTLLVSTLPDMLWQTWAGSLPSWIAWPKVGLLIFLVLLGWVVRQLKPLRLYFLMLAVINFGYWANQQIRSIPRWSEWEASSSWPLGMAGIQALEFTIGVAMVVILFSLRFRRKDLYLAKGQLNAPGDPIPWLGMKQPVSWMTFALIFAGISFVGSLAISSISTTFTLKELSAVLAFLPAILLVAASNGINEELIYRSALFPSLSGCLGKYQLLLLNAVFFGLAHSAGTFPTGLIWAAVVAFQGWVYGKAMLETRGFFWSWFMHAIADVPVFFFSAIVSQ